MMVGMTYVRKRWREIVDRHGFVESVDDVDLEEISWLELKWKHPVREDKAKNTKR